LSSTRTHLLGAAALVAALVLPGAAFAQTPAPLPPAPGAAVPGQPGQPGRHRHRHGGLRAALQSLNLTDAQKSQIQQLISQNREANRNADPATRKANRQALRAKIEAILTPAQRTQLQAALKRNHRKRGA
jgi:Spy/CpxP family protein refolding chaperone